MVKALVLDDEAIIAADITHQLNARVGWQALAVTSVVTAREHLRTDDFDVLFLDIEMPGCDGMTFAEEVKSLRPGLHIVFSTAYPEHAARAFRLSAVDYIVKPLSRSVLADACRRVEDKCQDPAAAAGSSAKFVIKSFGKTDLVPMQDVIVARAERNYVALLCGAREYLHRSTIAEVEADLGPLGYIRCHRSFIVKKSAVKTLIRKNGVLNQLKLADQSEIPVGANYRAAVQAVLLND